MPKHASHDHLAGFDEPDFRRSSKKRRWFPWLVAGALLTLIAAASVPFIAADLVFGGAPKTIPLTTDASEKAGATEIPENPGGDILGSTSPEDLTLPTVDPGATAEEVKDRIADTAKANIPSVTEISEEEILVHAEKVCANLDRGWGPVQLATQMDLPVHGMEERAKFLGLAVGMGCPEHTDDALGWYEKLQKLQALQR